MGWDKGRSELLTFTDEMFFQSHVHQDIYENAKL